MWRKSDGNELKFHALEESFELFLEDYDESTASDELKKDIKYFHRFVHYWKGRAETSDPATSGLFSNYHESLEQWIAEPVCESGNPLPWTEMGPVSYTGHYMGRVDCAWTDPFGNPNVVFAGTSASGLWKTINGGDSWY
ncbi:MAG: hypothetical protein ACI8XB_000942 [Patiriisocius sp.]|jgi:hypothetical protein